MATIDEWRDKVVDMFREGKSRSEIASELSLPLGFIDMILRDAVQPGGE